MRRAHARGARWQLWGQGGLAAFSEVGQVCFNYFFCDKDHYDATCVALVFAPGRSFATVLINRAFSGSKSDK